MKSSIQISLTLLVVCVMTVTAASLDDVTVGCDSCKGSKLNGQVGDDLVLSFNINRDKMFLFHIFYNSTFNDIRISKVTCHSKISAT